MHQILLSRPFREEQKQDIREGSLLGRHHRIQLPYTQRAPSRAEASLAEGDLGHRVKGTEDGVGVATRSMSLGIRAAGDPHPEMIRAPSPCGGHWAGSPPSESAHLLASSQHSPRAAWRHREED